MVNWMKIKTIAEALCYIALTILIIYGIYIISRIYNVDIPFRGWRF